LQVRGTREQDFALIGEVPKECALGESRPIRDLGDGRLLESPSP
jgi:hypothetical protein